MVETLRQAVLSVLTAKRWVVGFSGGVDSLALLHAVTQIPQHPPIVALHINHQIHPSSDQWVETCRVVSASIGVPFYEEKIQIESRSNLEKVARDARYQAFEAFLQSGDVLMLGQHQQDQVETFFYRLLRGAGLKGLSAMPASREVGRGLLLRPLLVTSKAEIQAYAEFHQLMPVQDESNFDQAFDRNYLRHSVLPVIENRWPNAQSQIEKTLSHLEEANQLLDELAKEDLSRTSSSEIFEPWVAFGGLLSLSHGRQKNALRYWLYGHAVRLSAKQHEVLFKEVLDAEVDAKPELIVGQVILRRFKQRLYITGCKNPMSTAQKQSTWVLNEALEAVGYPPLKLTHPINSSLSVRYRGEIKSVRLADNRPRQKISTLLQALEIPYWRRDSIPLILEGEQLLAVGDVFVSTYGKAFFKDVRIVAEIDD